MSKDKELIDKQSSNIPPMPYYPYPPIYTDDDDIDLYQLWLILKKRKKIIIGTTLLFTLLGGLYILISPPVYKTDTTIFPLQGNQNSPLTSLAASLPIPIPSSSSSLTVETILKSRTLKERIIKKLNLMPILFSSLWDNKTKSWKEPDKAPTILDGVKKLDKLMSVSTDKKTGVITLTVEFPKNPLLTYQIAETALTETQKILNEKTWTLASKTRQFLERQISIVLSKLNTLEKIYKQFLEGKINQVPLIVTEDLLRNLNEEINSLNATNNKISMEQLKRKIRKIEKTIMVNNGYRNLSDYQFNYQRIQWQLQVLQNLLNSLLQQYEIIKQQEVKEQVAFQVVDPPYIPDKRKPYKPKKLLILIVSFVSGLFLGIFGAFFKEWLDNIKNKENTVRT